MFKQMADSAYTTNIKRVKKNMEYFSVVSKRT